MFKPVAAESTSVSDMDFPLYTPITLALSLITWRAFFLSLFYINLPELLQSPVFTVSSNELCCGFRLQLSLKILRVSAGMQESVV